MPLDLSAPRVITFSVTVAIALIAAIIHYAHLAVRLSTAGSPPVSRLFGAGCWQCASRVVGKAEQITKDAGRSWLPGREEIVFPKNSNGRVGSGK
jgi:hypothetical protein